MAGLALRRLLVELQTEPTSSRSVRLIDLVPPAQILATYGKVNSSSSAPRFETPDGAPAISREVEERSHNTPGFRENTHLNGDRFERCNLNG